MKSNIKKSAFYGHGAMIGAEFFWGASSPIGKIILLGGITPVLLNSTRMAGAMLLFWIVSFFTRYEKVKCNDLKLIFIASLLCITLNQGLTIYGLQMTSPINASVISTGTPILTLVLSVIFFKEALTTKKVIGICIGAFGAIMLIFGSSNAVGSSSITGDLLVLSGQICFSCYLVFFKQLIKRYSPITLMKWMFTFSTICLIPFAITEFPSYNFNCISPNTIYLIILFIIGPTFLSFMLLPVGQRVLSPIIVSMYNYLQPAVAFVLSLLMGLGDFTLLKCISIAMVVVGVYIVTKSMTA